MAYEPTEWKKGDKITAEKLNKLENGVAAIAGVKVVNDVDDVLTSTYADIWEAFSNGTPVFVYIDNDDSTYSIGLVADIDDYDYEKHIYVSVGGGGTLTYECENADEYPHRDLA